MGTLDNELPDETTYSRSTTMGVIINVVNIISFIYVIIVNSLL